MSPLVAYARIAMSFRNMYRKSNPGGNRTASVTFAMSGLLIGNIVSLILCIFSVDQGWLASKRRIGRIEFAMLCIGVFLVQFIVIDWINRRAAGDKLFAAKISAAPPRIAIWYIFLSIVLLWTSLAVAMWSR
jgi:hypothetical protein